MFSMPDRVERMREPSAWELAEIVAEEELIAAEVAVVDAESALLRAPGEITAFRLERAHRKVRRVLAARRLERAGSGIGGAA
jgi:hypothetical protein